MSGMIFDERGFGSADQLISWKELQAVGIRTTSDGPFAEDVFWQFLLPGHLLELPGMAMTGERIGVLQRQLPGFDNHKVIRAMGSAHERTFRIWHPDAPATTWDSARFAARFTALIGRLGGERGRADPVFARLAAAWGEPHRRYHDREHLAECLRALDGIAAAPPDSDLAELALWFHDAVYQPRARDNEERSAGLLLAEATGLGIDAARAETAAELVCATSHASGNRSPSPAAALVLDADLSVLGSDPFRFMEYEYGIREEYAFVPSLRFHLGRGRLLADLLECEVLFHTPFGKRLEARTRAQLEALLRSPGYRAHRWMRWLPRSARG